MHEQTKFEPRTRFSLVLTLLTLNLVFSFSHHSSLLCFATFLIVPALQGYESRQDHGHGREQREDDERAVVYEAGVDRSLERRVPASEHRVCLSGYVKGGRTTNVVVLIG